MSEERIEIPATPEGTSPKAPNTRRYSTGGAFTSKNGEKITPHYLIATTNTCHELCKYGKPHAFEETRKHSVLKGNRGARLEGQIPIKKGAQVEEKLDVKPKTKRDQKVKALPTPRIIKQEVKIIKRDSSATKTIASAANEKPIVDLKPTSAVAKSSSINKGGVVANSISASSAKQTPVVAKLPSLKRIVVGKVRPATSLKPTPVVSKSPSLKRISVAAKVKPAFALKPSPGIAKSPSIKRIGVVAKAKPATPAVTKTSPLNSSRAVAARRNSDVTFQKVAWNSNIAQNKAIMESRRASLPSRPCVHKVETSTTKDRRILKAPSPVKIQKKVSKDAERVSNDEKVIEKTLYIIEPKPAEECPEPSHSETSLSSASSCPSSSSPSFPSHEREGEDDHEASECASSEENSSVTKSARTKIEKQMKTSTVESKKGVRKTTTIRPEVKAELSRKLNFIKGKVVNPQPENNVAWRLRFNKGRVPVTAPSLNHNVKSETKKKSFTRRELIEPDTTELKPEAEQVLLRHQDAEEKNPQGLLNNVIEEAASKLVEARKSKVKALVGAFETVISLHETNSLTATSIG